MTEKRRCMCGECESQGRTGTGPHGETTGAEHCACWYEGKDVGQELVLRAFEEIAEMKPGVRQKYSEALAERFRKTGEGARR